MPTIEERFWSKVEKTETCWIWRGSMFSTGYGAFHPHHQAVGAHRFAYELLVGPIPEGLHLDHLCRNPPCVNPAHLEPVSPRTNVMRGLTVVAANAAKTHCLRGHPFDVANTHIGSHGQRVCRACAKTYRPPPTGPQNAAKTRCKRGHEFTTENTFRNANGARVCRQCRLSNQRNRIAKA